MAGPTFAGSAAPHALPYCTTADFIDREHADKQEESCLQLLLQSVSRQGDVLTLKLEDGAAKTYRNNSAACDHDDGEHCAHYWLVGYHPTARIYILLAGGYDDFDCILVSARDGAERPIGGLPHFAPDNSTFIVIFDLDGFAIGSVQSPDKYTRMDWDDNSNDGEYWRFQAWLDNEHIALKFEGQSDVCPNGGCGAVLARIGDSWVLQRRS